MNEKQTQNGLENAAESLADRIAKHPMYSESDLAYFRDKGYTDEEILAFWDRDHAWGHKPLHHKPIPNTIETLIQNVAAVTRMRLGRK